MKKLLFVILLLCVSHFGAQAQKPKAAKQESDWANARLENAFFPIVSKHVVQALVSGREATAVSGGEVMVKQFKLMKFRNGDTNQVQIIARTPECLFNPEARTAQSTNTVQAHDPATNFFITGRGFFCSYTNTDTYTKSTVIISNEVVTRVNKALVKSSIPATSKNNATNLLIYSDHFELQHESNLVIYTGHVRVIDSQMQLNCDQLIGRYNTNRFKTNAGIEQITALRNVDITIPNKGHATGDKAVYIMNDETESIELTGHAIWNDGQREARAGRFTLDRRRYLLQAYTNVVVNFPNGMINQTNLAGSPLAAVASGATTNGYSELFADRVSIQLSETDSQPKTILAENNVLITNRFDKSRATGDRAFYSAAENHVELTGDPLPVWQTAKGEIRGRVLAITGRTNQAFSSHGNSRLSIYLPENYQTSQARKAEAETDKPLLVITSDNFVYQSNEATFDKDVRAEILRGTKSAGTLASQLLRISFGVSNRVEKIIARDHVRAFQPADGVVQARSLACDALAASLWPGTDYLRDAKAEGNVAVTEISTTNTIQLNAGLVTARFLSSSNTIEHAQAETNVVGIRFEPNGKVNQVSGEHIVYTANSPDPFVITGNPRIKYWPGKQDSKTNVSEEFTAPSAILHHGAQSLHWDPKTQDLISKGGRIVPLTNAAPIAPKASHLPLP